MYNKYDFIQDNVVLSLSEMLPFIETIIDVLGRYIVVDIHNPTGYSIHFEQGEDGGLEAIIRGNGVSRFIKCYEDLIENLDSLMGLPNFEDSWEVSNSSSLYNSLELIRERINLALSFMDFQRMYSKDTYDKAFEEFSRVHIFGRSDEHIGEVPELNWKAYCERFGEDYNDERAMNEELSSVCEVYRISHELYNELYYRGEKVLKVVSFDTVYYTFYWFRRGAGSDLRDEDVLKNIVMAHNESPIDSHAIDTVPHDVDKYEREEEPDEYHIRVPHITVGYRTFMVSARDSDDAYEMVKKSPKTTEYEDEESIFEAFDWNNTEAYNVSGKPDLCCSESISDFDDDDSDYEDDDEED